MILDRMCSICNVALMNLVYIGALLFLSQVKFFYMIFSFSFFFNMYVHIEVLE